MHSPYSVIWRVRACIWLGRFPRRADSSRCCSCCAGAAAAAEGRQAGRGSPHGHLLHTRNRLSMTP